MKEAYIDIMEKALLAYGDDRIKAFFSSVKKEGLTEHGFVRLTSNMGILISFGRQTHLLPLFVEMMDFCAENVPRVKAANDFSVREMVSCILALKGKGVLPDEKLSSWSESLSHLTPESCYSIYATSPDDKVHNWALFTAVSEYARMKAGMGGSLDFIELQLETQVRRLDENGMYMDNFYSDIHQPIVYDLVPRMLFSFLLYLGYRGRFYETIDSALKKAGGLTLLMQSVSGECAFGGRSNGFLHNECILAAVLEFEARRYKREGDFALASRFGTAADKAVSALEKGLSERPVSHVKNRFPTESHYGCEGYAYFDKYMITVASFSFLAYLFSEETEKGEETDGVFLTSCHFHKLFMKKGGISLEFDLNADAHYDASGLGRVQLEGAPSCICISSPCPDEHAFEVNESEGIALSFGVGAIENGKPVFSKRYEVLEAGKDTSVLLSDGVKSVYKITENGVEIEVSGDGEIALMLPAFYFDGKEYTEIAQGESTLEIRYRGFVSKYLSSTKIHPLHKMGYSRNGHYKAFFTTAKNRLNVKIEISKE